MSNTYFQFKQFTIHQERCGMKVCTDGCLFGAWIAAQVRNEKYEVQTVLDIGTGTGLLSLMLAQQSDAVIDALELDEHAAEQAAENFESTPWKERLQVIQGDARKVHLGRKYDLIISNPPFFENDLKSGDEQRNLALHSKELNLRELLLVVKKYLAEQGRFAVLLPHQRKNKFETMALTEGLYPEEAISVKQTPVHSFFRVMLLFATVKIPVRVDTITIHDEGKYTSEFIGLLKDYYLKL
jgi:tRNA1Val (adenine37-N6)-methyltransferase